jgi:AmmeMemoRadiSam system protein B
MHTRSPAVAGLFYESDARHLRQHIASLLHNVDDQPRPFPRALVVPHAGYIYSGRTAAEAYARLRHHERPIKRVALFGPAHRVYLEGMAVPSVDSFETPLGNIALDQDAIDRLRRLEGVSVSDEAHRDEHSLEVQLPFLQTLLASFSLVPVVVGQCNAGAVARAMEALWQCPDTLLVVSTDLSHFHSYEQARNLDADTCQRILARESGLSGEQACGARAVNGLLTTERSRGLDIELIDLCNSGDTAGDRERVVGYAAFSLH